MYALSTPALTRGPEHHCPDVPDATDVRLLARALDDAGPDAVGLATAILSACGGPAGLVFASRSQLVAAGLTPLQAERLRAAVGLALRAAAAPPPSRKLDRATALALFRPVLAPLQHEEMHVLFMGSDGTFIGRERVAQGGSSMLALHVRDVLAPAVESRAALIVLAHNHPQGNSAPSPEDVALSERVEKAAPWLGIRLVDHLVFSRDGVGCAMPSGARWPMPGPCRTV